MNLVFDTCVLSCFARAGRLATLDLLTEGKGRRVTTRAVLDELRRGATDHSELAAVEDQHWLYKVAVDGLQELQYFAEYARRLVDHRNRNVGEASALAWIRVHGGIFLTDDQTAIAIAKENKVKTLRTLSLIASGVCTKLLSEEQSSTLVDELLAGGAHFPCKGGAEFLSWANREGLFERCP